MCPAYGGNVLNAFSGARVRLSVRPYLHPGACFNSRAAGRTLIKFDVLGPNIRVHGYCRNDRRHRRFLIMTCLVPNACGNYALRYGQHAGPIQGYRNCGGPLDLGGGGYRPTTEESGF